MMGIAARSTNTKGFVHFGGDVVSGVEDGIGILVGSAATGGTAFIEPLADGSTAAIGLKAKGTAALTLGNSSNTVDIIGSAITLTGAGSPIKGAYSTTFAYTFTALSSGAVGESNIATTTADVQPGDLISISLDAPTPSTSTISFLGFRQSTAAASRVVLLLGNIASTAIGATGSGVGRITWLDLT